VGVGYWRPQRGLWFTVDAFQEPLDRGYVTHWAPLPHSGQALTHLIEQSLSFPAAAPWSPHMPPSAEAHRESALDGTLPDALADPDLPVTPYNGAAYRPVINQRLRAVLADSERAALDLDMALFALDAAIQWSVSPPSVARSALLDGLLFDAAASFLFAGGASWIHANLSIRSLEPPLIGIVVGPIIGNPRPAINISEITILDA